MPTSIKESEILSCLANNGFSGQESFKYVRNVRLEQKALMRSRIKQKEGGM